MTDIAVSFHELDPPEGVVMRMHHGEGPPSEPYRFVGWLGLFTVFQTLITDASDEHPT